MGSLCLYINYLRFLTVKLGIIDSPLSDEERASLSRSAAILRKSVESLLKFSA